MYVQHIKKNWLTHKKRNSLKYCVQRNICPKLNFAPCATIFNGRILKWVYFSHYNNNCVVTGQNNKPNIKGRKQPFIQYFSVFWPSPLTTRLRWLWGAVGFHTTRFWSREPVANRVESGDQSTHVALAEWVGSLNTSCKCKNCHSYQ